MTHPCKNYLECGKYAGNSSKLCEDCRKAARELDEQAAEDWRAVGWTRYEDNQRAKNGHKHGKDEK